MPRSFPPVIGRRPKVLILGSMPGRASLRLKQYYGHPQNQFWRLLGAVLKEELAKRPYARRLALLKRRGVALWDVLAACRRPGSLDSAITDESPNPAADLAARAGVRAVFFNGRKARESFLRHHGSRLPGIALRLLPSTSPAHAGLSFAAKLRRWRAIARYLALALSPALAAAAYGAAQEPQTSPVPPAPPAAEASPAAGSAELTLHEIVDRANKTLRGDSSHGHLSMTIVTPSWERTLEVEGWNRGRQMAFISILAPAKDKGGITLRRLNEMWIWLPKVERVIKIPPTMMHTSWQGSDFTYEDIVKADSVVKDYEHKLLDKKAEKDRVVYTIEGRPKPDAPVVWGRIVMKVAVYGGQEAVPLLEEDYSERGELIRIIELSGIQRMGGRLLPTRLECRPTKKPGQRTVLVYHSLEFDIPLEDSFFSLARLQKGER